MWFLSKRRSSSQSSPESVQHLENDATFNKDGAIVVSEREVAASRSGTIHPDGKIELQVADWEEELAYGWSRKKKWLVITVIFAVQMSMNFNASVYGNAIKPLSEKYGVSNWEARMGQLAFLVAYAFGCELWAPWSEEYGRKWVLQLSLAFVNIWQIPCLFAPNFKTVLAARVLGGLSSAGGSVTLGMVADMWHADTQQYAVAWVVLSSVGGSVFGPVVGGAIEQYLPLKYNFIFQLAIGLVVQFIHAFTPETRSDVLLDRIAKKLRKTNPNIYGPNEIKTKRFSFSHATQIWIRPFKMFITEPIVLCLSLLSGFSDALIFTFLEAYGPVYAQWGFGPLKNGVAFLAIGAGYIIAWLLFLPRIHHDIKTIKSGKPYPPEQRLWLLCYLTILLPLGLFIFAATSLGPKHNIPWIAPMIASCLIGIANYAIYMATIDYMIAAYGEYSASATGGNGFARDFLAGICVLYTKKLFTNVGTGTDMQLVWPSIILGCIALVICVPVYVFYFKGEWFRERSSFAMSLQERDARIAVRKAEKAHTYPQQV